MNAFRILGDLSRFFAISYLIFALHRRRTTRSISFSTQLLYVVVCCSRYLDVFWFSYGTYNTVGKIFWTTSAVYIVVLTRTKSSSTLSITLDELRIEHLAGPCAALALAFNYLLQPMEILWTFSIYLEAVAILPQLFLSYKLRKEQTTMSGQDAIERDIAMPYIVLMCTYRGFYILNWIQRYFQEEKYTDPVSIAGGLVQMGLYIGFFSLYLYLE